MIKPLETNVIVFESIKKGPDDARRDVGNLRANHPDPFLEGVRNKLRAVVRSIVLRYAMWNELVGKNVDDVSGLQLPIDPDRQCFVRKLVDDIRYPIFPAFVGAILDKVVRPDVIGALGTQNGRRNRPPARAGRAWVV